MPEQKRDRNNRLLDPQIEHPTRGVVYFSGLAAGRVDGVVSLMVCDSVILVAEILY